MQDFENVPLLQTAKELIFKDHRITLEVEEGASPFTQEHIDRITRILDFYWQIDPELVKKYSFFLSEHSIQPNWFNRFPRNGENIVMRNGRTGIIFTEEGMNLHSPHRISSSQTEQELGFVDSFSGTVAHELCHGGDVPLNVRIFSDEIKNVAFVKEWVEKFNWKMIEEDGEDYETFSPVVTKNGIGWKTDEIPDPGWVKNSEGYWQKGEYVIYRDEFALQPETCIGGINSYASSVRLREDICDSVAAYILNPNLIYPGKKEIIDKHLKEYRQH